MRAVSIEVAALVAILVGCGPAAAQEGRATVVGTLRDRTSGSPVAGASIVFGEGVAALTDSLGRYSVPAVAGEQTVRLYCPTQNAWFAQRLPYPHRVRTYRDSTVVVDIAIDVAACTEPPRDSVRAEFRGHYRGGFELSEFVPCPGSLAPSPRTAHIQRTQIWVDMSERAWRAYARTRPRGAETRGEVPWRYVRWSGMMTGPGSFGHFGMAFYLLSVEVVHGFQVQSPADCPPPPRIH